jgi:5-methylcytosine-specific restriction endonuclease McrA
MQRAIDNRFYRSKAWRECRAAYIRKCGGLCERCLEKGIYRPGYIVHHKIHLDSDNYMTPEVALSFNNLEFLCLDCHNLEHEDKIKKFFEPKPRRKWSDVKHDRFTIDDSGNVTIK